MLKIWSCNIPTCQHLAPPCSKDYFHYESEVAKLGRRVASASSSMAPLPFSPVAETPPPPPAALPRTTSAQASGGAKSWTSPAPGSAPLPLGLSACGCGELSLD